MLSKLEVRKFITMVSVLAFVIILPLIMILLCFYQV